MPTIKEILTQFEEENKTIALGVCDAAPFASLRESLAAKKEVLKGFVNYDIEKRIDPCLTLPSAKRILVLAQGYKKEFSFPKDNIPRGYFSQGAIGEDYHHSIVRKLEELAQRLKQIQPFSYCIFSDTGPLSDRAAAVRAGIGSIGRHQGVINQKLGSMIFIGYMITDLVLPLFKEDKTDYCKDCQKCLLACPTGALTKEGFHMEKCISYLTQKKGILTYKEMKAMKKQLYGCDICQVVCPQNKKIPAEKIDDIKKVSPSLEEILTLSNKQFQKRFASTAAGWRGKKILQRNALIALGNQKKNEKSLSLLQSHLNDPREEISTTAKMALYLLEEETPWDTGKQED